jgi:hypothetical protein
MRCTRLCSLNPGVTEDGCERLQRSGFVFGMLRIFFHRRGSEWGAAPACGILFFTESETESNGNVVCLVRFGSVSRKLDVRYQNPFLPYKN